MSRRAAWRLQVRDRTGQDAGRALGRPGTAGTVSFRTRNIARVFCGKTFPARAGGMSCRAAWWLQVRDRTGQDAGRTLRRPGTAGTVSFRTRNIARVFCGKTFPARAGGMSRRAAWRLQVRDRTGQDAGRALGRPGTAGTVSFRTRNIARVFCGKTFPARAGGMSCRAAWWLQVRDRTGQDAGRTLRRPGTAGTVSFRTRNIARVFCGKTFPAQAGRANRRDLLSAEARNICHG